MPSLLRNRWLPALLLVSVAMLLLVSGAHTHNGCRLSGCLWCVVAWSGILLSLAVPALQPGAPVLVRARRAPVRRSRGPFLPAHAPRAPPAA